QNITVNLYEDENADPETATVIDTVQTDAEGDYTFESVDIGDYTVEATDPDYVDEIQNVTVSAGEDITDVDFSLETVEKDGVANFKVEITDYDNEVIKKEEITVEYTVTNTGDEEGTQDIVFSIDGDKEDSVEGITLDAEEERSGQFTWETEEEGEYTLEIATEDDDHSVDVTVNPYPDDEAFFVVEITDQEVDGNELRIEYTATNEGGEKGTQDIKFLINGEEIAEENVELEPDESFTGNFTHLIEEAGEYECEVQSEYGTEDSVKQTVEEDYGPEDEDPSYLREYGWLIALLVIGIVVAVGFLIMRGKGGALTSQSEEEMEEEYGEEEMFDEPEETEEELLEEEPEDEL
ncbi:MAG: CARDB domain-containing protein, partial [Candidatus Natronoplasma sp.]